MFDLSLTIKMYVCIWEYIAEIPTLGSEIPKCVFSKEIALWGIHYVCKILI